MSPPRVGYQAIICRLIIGFICVCVCVCMSVCLSVCLCLSLSLYIYIYAFVCVCVCVLYCVCVCVFISKTTFIESTSVKHRRHIQQTLPYRPPLKIALFLYQPEKLKLKVHFLYLGKFCKPTTSLNGPHEFIDLNGRFREGVFKKKCFTHLKRLYKVNICIY